LFSSSGIGAKLNSYSYDQSIVTSQGYGYSATGNETWLANTVAQSGPVSVCIYASSKFSNYQSGLFFV